MLSALICPRFSEAKCLRDEDVLQNLPVGTTASFYFSDLGPQLTWGTVSDVIRKCCMCYLMLCFTVSRGSLYDVFFKFIPAFIRYRFQRNELVFAKV